jgi:hypothetical protein
MFGGPIGELLLLLQLILSAALAAKGGDVSSLPANPVMELHARRASYKEFPEGGDLDDAASPILAKVPGGQARGSYQSPYDIR